METRKPRSPEPQPKEYTYEEFLKQFAPDADREERDAKQGSASQIGRDIAARVLKELRQNLAKK